MLFWFFQLMRRNLVYFSLLAISIFTALVIKFIAQNIITEEELAQIEARKDEKLDFCTPILFACSGLLTGILVRNIVLILWTHL